MDDVSRDDEFDEFDTTNEEFEAMWAKGLPGPFALDEGQFIFRFSVVHTPVSPLPEPSGVGLRVETGMTQPVLAEA